MIGLKVAGGLFLIYLAVQALRAKKSDYASLSAQVNVNEKQETTFFKEFIVGFMSGILKPRQWWLCERFHKYYDILENYLKIATF
jgi:threonine/homoserine/homoserine lactone efflux protein